MNQTLEKVRQLVPKTVDREALSIMREFRGRATVKGVASVPLSVGNAYDMLFGEGHENFTGPEFATTALSGIRCGM